MPNMMEFAMQMIRNNPNVANNPNAQHMIDVIQSGNAQEGERLANQLLQANGLTKEQGLQQAASFFNIS